MTVVMETGSEHPSAEGTLLSSFRENADFAAEQGLGEGNAREISAAEAAKRITEAFGKVVGVLMRSPQHKQSKLADLEWMVVPAIMTGQFTLAEARSKSDGTTAPVGFVSWARVSADVDARLAASTEQPLLLSADEWRSGDIVWIIDAAGERRVVQQMLKRIVEKEGQDRTIKVRVNGKDGKPTVGRLSKGKVAEH